jgi:hypothetical protein
MVSQKNVLTTASARKTTTIPPMISSSMRSMTPRYDCATERVRVRAPKHDLAGPGTELSIWNIRLIGTDLNQPQTARGHAHLAPISADPVMCRTWN